MAGRTPILEDPEKHNVTFEKRQWKDLEKQAKTQKRSIHDIIREAVDQRPAVRTDSKEPCN